MTPVDGRLGGFVSFRAFADFSATKRPQSMPRNLPKHFSCISRMNAETPTWLKHTWHVATMSGRCCQMLSAPYRPSLPFLVEMYDNFKCRTGQGKYDVGLCQISIQLNPSKVTSHHALVSSCFPTMKRVCTPFVASSMYLASE